MGTLEIQETLFQRSGRLFARPSFLSGCSRVLDMGSTFDEYNQDDTPREADRLALQGDWYSVGDDLRYVIHKLHGSLEESGK